MKGVGVVSYLLEQQVLLERDGLQTMATLRGVDDRYTEVFPIEETIPLGSWSVRTGDLDRLVLGRDMARTLGIRSLVRAEVAVYALRRGSFSSLLPVDGYSVRRLDVGGLFFLDLESENEYALTLPACSPGTFRSSGTHIGDLGARSRRCGRGKGPA